jgi:hypothetical protein
MEPTILDNLPWQPDLVALERKLHIKDGRRSAVTLERLAQEAATIGRPRAMVRVAYVDARGESNAVIDGVRFDSRVLCVNLEKTHRVFPFLATCGSELYEWTGSQDDMLLRYYADTISEMAMRQASRVVEEHLVERYRLGRTSSISPGSLSDWPIQAQRPLFALLGNTEEAIGVRLSDSLVMVPTKSVSGIRFPTEQSFASCQLCPRQGCPSRQAPYDGALYASRYGLEEPGASRREPRLSVPPEKSAEPLEAVIDEAIG